MLEAVEEIVALLDTQLLPVERLGVTFERLRDLLTDSARRRGERQARRQAEDFDEEEAEALQARRRRSWVQPRTGLHETPGLRNPSSSLHWWPLQRIRATEGGGQWEQFQLYRRKACCNVIRAVENAQVCDLWRRAQHSQRAC